MIGDAVDKHRVAHQTAGQLEPRFSLLTKLLIHPSLSIFAHTHTEAPCSRSASFIPSSLTLVLLWNEGLSFDHDDVERQRLCRWGS